MKQIIIRRLPISDLFLNTLLKIRMWIYVYILTFMLKNQSDPNKPGRELVFEDDFEEVSWGKSSENRKWIWGEGWGLFHPDNPHTYYGEPELLETSSCAKFTIKYNPRTFKDDLRTGNPITINFQNSLLSTQRSFRQQYGRFECRCTQAFDKGVWNAFWMWGSKWPPEIDVYENYGKKTGKSAAIQEINLHYGVVADGTKSAMRGWGVRYMKKPDAKKFNEFVCEWSPKKIEFFTNGVRVFRYTRKDVLDKWFNDPVANMWVVINHGFDSNIVHQDEKDYYSEFLVDYIRVYK